MIVTEGLSKTFRVSLNRGLWRRESRTIHAVQGLDMRIEPGRIVGLLGVNGAGKTTTIKILATLLDPSGGRAEVDGLDVVRDSRRVKEIVNVIVSGERMLYWRLTGYENLWYFAQLYGLPGAVAKERIRSLLELVGLADASHLAVEKYSKGMKQRLHVARGLINDPRYVLMDEPTLGLDAPVARQLRAFARDLAARHGKGILLTSHYMHEVEELCDYVYLIHSGRLVMEGTPAELKRQAGQRYVLHLAVSEYPDALRSAMEALCGESGASVKVSKDTDGCELEIVMEREITPEVVNLVASQGVRLLRLHVTEPSLEDALVAITGGVTT